MTSQHIGDQGYEDQVKVKGEVSLDVHFDAAGRDLHRYFSIVLGSLIGSVMILRGMNNKNGQLAAGFSIPVIQGILCLLPQSSLRL